MGRVVALFYAVVAHFAARRRRRPVAAADGQFRHGLFGMRKEVYIDWIHLDCGDLP
jgi:hypothetical protein